MSSGRPSLLRTVRRLWRDLLALVRLGLTSRGQLAAENLFLRKRLALYQERPTRPLRPDPATRVALVLLSRWLDFRVLHAFVVLDVGTRRVLYWNVTEDPTADWTVQVSERSVFRDPSVLAFP